MFVCSVKAGKAKIWFVLAGLITLVLLGGLLPGREKAASAAITVQGGTNEERIGFLRQFGWEPQEEPAEICEILIPEDFTGVYEVYQQLQQSQGFDLRNWRGKRVRRWSYLLKNPPENAGETVADLLIADGRIIGGDICSREMNGVLQGFHRDAPKISLPLEESGKKDV